MPKIANFPDMQTPKRADLLPRLAELGEQPIRLRAERFDALAREVYHYQSVENPLYARYLALLNRPGGSGRPSLSGIPFLPIRFFKTHDVKSGDWRAATVFTSSSATGQTPSRHPVRDTGLYLENTVRGFRQFYGDPSDWCVLALLPSYLERGGSSLVAMADHFIKCSSRPESGFFLYDFDRLKTVLIQCKSKGYKTLLLGVSYALLDFAEQFPMDMSGVTVMETGGMKGRRREITRAELHQTLRAAFQLADIHSEYGMTELFSQAYSTGGALFTPAATLRVLTTEINDPFCPTATGRTGVLNIIDLANIDTCSFIQTEDVGKVYTDGRFEVLGRLDAAELRGCNLMVE